MIFYERKNLPRVWSGKNKRPVVAFHDGVFETEDQELIDLLVKAGYPHENEVEGTSDDSASKPIFDFTKESEWKEFKEKDHG
jgi:hypothetical protein